MQLDRIKHVDEITEIDGIEVEKLMVEDDNKAMKKQPKISFNAMDMTMNLFRQYSKMIYFADRNLFKIHDPLINAKDMGDAKQVYVEFSSGVFEALKKNMVQTLDDNFGIKVIIQPKLEKYGTTKADSKVCLDVKLEVMENVHFVKVCVYITKCAIDVAGMTKHQPMKARAYNAPEKEFAHLDNQTVGDLSIS